MSQTTFTAAPAARPTIGILGAQKGRRFLVVSGCLLTALTTYDHMWADTYAVILLMRLLIGAFQQVQHRAVRQSREIPAGRPSVPVNCRASRSPRSSR